MKVCSKCKQEKPYEEFSKRASSKDGLHPHCKDCVKQYYEQNKERISEQRKQHYEQNKERLLEQKKQYREQNRERLLEYGKQHYEQNKERRLEQSKQYYEQNKERIKQYYEQNKERISEQRKQYREQNKERILEQSKQYYRTSKGKFSEYKSGAKQRGIEFHLTMEQFESFWQKPCEYCGAEIETIGLDRLDSDGHYTMNNVVSCCWSCNKEKGKKTLEEWNKMLDNKKLKLKEK